MSQPQQTQRHLSTATAIGEVLWQVIERARRRPGDGGDSGQVAYAPDGEWIGLYHPQMIALGGALNSPELAAQFNPVNPTPVNVPAKNRPAEY